MARAKPDQPLVPSVLDRLIDEEPDIKSEPAKSRMQVLRDLKESVRRDLECLMNTRIRWIDWEPHLDELERSLLDYGIPDITGANLGATKDREIFCRKLETMLEQNEPRFKTVRVVQLSNADAIDRTLRFRIEAMLRVDPAPEPVVFDSTLDPSRCDFQVKGVSE